jgi:hypothetical protein
VSAEPASPGKGARFGVLTLVLSGTAALLLGLATGIFLGGYFVFSIYTGAVPTIRDSLLVGAAMDETQDVEPTATPLLEDNPTPPSESAP